MLSFPSDLHSFTTHHTSRSINKLCLFDCTGVYSGRLASTFSSPWILLLPPQPSASIPQGSSHLRMTQFVRDPEPRAPWVFFSFSVWLSPFCSHQAHMWHLEPHNSWHIGLECLPVASHPRPLDHLGWRWELSPPFPQHTYIHRHKHTHIHKHSTYTQMCIHTHAYKHTDIYIPPPPPPPGWGVGLREKTETFICF